MIPLIIAVISAGTHLFRFGQPAAVVFDEVHAGNFLTNYWHGSYFFDVHPPLGKLIEMAFGYLTGANQAVVDYTLINNPIPSSVILLRLIPLVAGILLPIIVYYVLRRLNFTKITATTTSILLCLENSLIVQSRYILYDVIMLALGFLAILCYLKWRDCPVDKRRNRFYLFAISLIAAAAVPCIKWTGLAFPLIIILMEIYNNWPGWSNLSFNFIKKHLGFAFRYVSVFVVLYVALFGIHFAILSRTGPGDAFMSSEFRKTLFGSPESGQVSLKTENFAEKFIELNITMFRADQGLTKPHSYSSKWYTWPLEIRPIFYWQSHDSTVSTSSEELADTAKSRSYIYLLGNPVIYWLGSISIITLVLYGVYLVAGRKLSELNTKQRQALFFVVVGFLANFLPFIFIGRVMFLYHYEAALVFSIIAVGLVIEVLTTERKKFVALVIIGLALISFVFFAPLTYGTPLSDQSLAERMWLPTWR